MFRFVAVLALAGAANAALQCPTYNVGYRGTFTHTEGGHTYPPSEEHTAAQSGTGFRMHVDVTSEQITVDQVSREDQEYGIEHYQSTNPDWVIDECHAFENEISFRHMADHLCAYSKSCGHSIPCPAEFPGHGACDCYTTEWGGEKAYTKAGSSTPGLVKVGENQFDDDWSGGGQELTIVFHEFFVDGTTIDDSVFTAPCHPNQQTKNLRASSTPKKVKNAIEMARRSWFRLPKKN